MTNSKTKMLDFYMICNSMLTNSLYRGNRILVGG